MPQVLNIRRHGKPAGAVYIGRPSKWGTPFRIGPDGNREQVVEKYRAWLCQYPGLIEEAKCELYGKDLICWCAPNACHGDVLLQTANG